MRSLCTGHTAQLWGMLMIAAAAVAAFLIGGDPAGAAIVGGLLLAFIAVVELGRRRSTSVEVLTGIGDERTRRLYERALAFVGSAMALVLPGWWLVTVALGDPNETLSLLCAVFACLLIGAVVVLPRRS